jgi:hypothetical protein
MMLTHTLAVYQFLSSLTLFVPRPVGSPLSRLLSLRHGLDDDMLIYLVRNSVIGLTCTVSDAKPSKPRFQILSIVANRE